MAEEQEAGDAGEASRSVLYCSKTTPSGKLAGAVLGCLEREGIATVHCIGSESVNQAVKAVCVAESMYEQNSTASNDKMALAMFPAFVRGATRNKTEEKPSFVMELKVRMLPRPPPLSSSKGTWTRERDEEGYPIILAKEKKEGGADGKGKKLGAMTGALKAAMQDAGVAKLRCFGPYNVNYAIRSLVQLGQFMRQDLGEQGQELEDKPMVAAFPSRLKLPGRQTAENQEPQKITAVQLTCVPL